MGMLEPQGAGQVSMRLESLRRGEYQSSPYHTRWRSPGLWQDGRDLLIVFVLLCPLLMLLPGCQLDTREASGLRLAMAGTTGPMPDRILFWQMQNPPESEAAESVAVESVAVGARACESGPDGTSSGATSWVTCNVPPLSGSDEAPLIFTLGVQTPFQEQLSSPLYPLGTPAWFNLSDWMPSPWPLQLALRGPVTAETTLNRETDRYGQMLPFTSEGLPITLQWADWPTSRGEDPRLPVEAWAVFWVGGGTEGEALPIALAYDGTAWSMDPGNGDNTGCVWQSPGSDGETSGSSPCYLAVPPGGQPYRVELYLRGSVSPVLTELPSSALSSGYAIPPLRCPGRLDGQPPYDVYYPDTDGDGLGDAASPIASCTPTIGYVHNHNDCESPTCLIDADGDGYTVEQGDCDDTNPAIHPGAKEVCDGRDNDCDELVDENIEQPWFLDQDEDGFGSDVKTSCTGGAGYTQARGDCNDTDPSIHPGALDPAGDGIDQDCGGSAASEPHVGLNARSFNTIQAALDASEDGQTVWVGPGTYYESDLCLKGQEVRLFSTEGQSNTILDAGGIGSVMGFVFWETEQTVVDGFTLQGASTGGIFLYNSSPELSHLTLKENNGVDGGGMSLYGSSPLLNELTLTDNSASYGGGMYLQNSSPLLDQVILSTNVAQVAGGGIYFDNSSSAMNEVELSNNTAGHDGGGMFLDESDAILNQVSLLANVANGNGGGIYLDSSSPTSNQVILEANLAKVDGGGMFLFDGADATLNQVIIRSNTAQSNGGGVYLSNSDPILNQVDLSENTAPNAGGGMFMVDSSPTLIAVIFTGNTAVSGGGAYFSRSAAILATAEFTGNVASSGGGLALNDSSPHLSDVLLSNNSANSGGGMILYSSHPSINRISIQGNVATFDGGGIVMYDSHPILNGGAIADNQAEASGGGMCLYKSSPKFDQITFADNLASDGQAAGNGGGLFLMESSPSFVQVTVSRNESQNAGGGIYLYSSLITWVNCVVAYNSAHYGGNLYAYYQNNTVSVTASALYNPSYYAEDNITPIGSYLAEEPRFLAYEEGLPSDFHLALDSPLIDAGDPKVLDLDGSRSDIGMYGGPEGGSWDRDGDGVFDYFWPGEWSDAPIGFVPDDYDCDDLDPEVQACP